MSELTLSDEVRTLARRIRCDVELGRSRMDNLKAEEEIAAMIDAYARSLVPEVPEDVQELAIGLMTQCTKEIKGYNAQKAARLITAFMEKQRPPNQDFNEEWATCEAVARYGDKNEQVQSDRDVARFVAGAEWQSRRQPLVIERPDPARDASIRKEAEKELEHYQEVNSELHVELSTLRMELEEAEEKAKLKAVWDEHFNLKIGNVLVARMFRPFPNTPQAWCVQLMWADPSRESAHKGDFTETEARGICDAHASQLISSLIASLSAEEGA